ncbi:hypothetical protein GpartN1_g5047.t1 [Galdieria partita]|uniref:Uncharacterized protein n=1 Tax=Galdieria partita TaxID=83374 RepID=A0A9C7URU2_9RHOD|nr:hypothetical protein GpartN1_g5047.t1 [Galdieria partita]
MRRPTDFVMMGFLTTHFSIRTSFTFRHNKCCCLVIPRRCVRCCLNLSTQESKKTLEIFSTWLSWFQGDFDNFEQVVEERNQKIFPREGGGHEHIHCAIQPLFCKPDGHVLLFAKYYFNGNPDIVFRFRVYEAFPSVSPYHPEEMVLEMKILRFYEEAASRLKQINFDIFQLDWNSDHMYEYLVGCEVYWKYNTSTHQSVGEGPHFIGFMKGGGCSVYSPETKDIIHVKDDLILTPNHLWVNDRGFDNCQNYIYGNQRGIHYQMKRVQSGDALDWTLKATHRPKPDIAKAIEELDRQWKVSHQPSC